MSGRSLIIVILLLVISLAVGVFMGRASTSGSIEDRNTRIRQLEEEKRGLFEENEGIQSRYLSITEDLDRAIADNDSLTQIVADLRGRVQGLIREVERSVVTIDSLHAEGTASIDSTTGHLSIRVAKQGVNLWNDVNCFSGEYSVLITHDPIEIVTVLAETDEGLLKKSITFPGQPWMSVSSWDIIVEEPLDPDQGSIWSRLFGNLGKIGVVGGGSIGKSPGIVLGASVGDIVLATESIVGDETRLMLTKRWGLFGKE